MSKVQLRRPRRIFGGNNGSLAQPAGRPKSWGEFNQNFVTVSEIVSASNADLSEIKEDTPITDKVDKQRTHSSSTLLNGPAFRSVLPPTFTDPRKKKVEESDDSVFNPTTDPKNKENSAKSFKQITDTITDIPLPEANNQTNIKSHTIFQDPILSKPERIDVSSDESCDSAIAVSFASNNHNDNRGAVWSPDSRGQRVSYDLDSISTASNCDATDTERIPASVPTKKSYTDMANKQPEENINSSSSSSDELQESYDADQSTEDFNQHAPVSLRVRKQINKKNRETREETAEPTKNVAHSTGTWPRRKKDKMEKSPEELMRQFREMSAEHMSKVRSIYSESRRKVDDLLLSLKLTMTKNGYNRDLRQRT